MKFRIVEEWIHQLGPLNFADPYIRNKYAANKSGQFKYYLTSAYELEYKLYKIRSDDKLRTNNPKRQKNLIEIGEKYLHQHLNYILKEFNSVFWNWIDTHEDYLQEEEDAGNDDVFQRTIHQKLSEFYDICENYLLTYKQKSIGQKIEILHRCKNSVHVTGDMLEYMDSRLGAEDGWTYDLFNRLSNSEDTGLQKQWDRELGEQGIEI